jgi:hypothetical protein
VQEENNLHSRKLEEDNSEEPQVAMEAACFNGQMDKLKELIELHSQSSNQHSQEWVRVYKLFYQRNTSNITPEALLKAVQYQTSEDPELFIAYRILHAYATYDADEYGILRSVCKTLNKEIEKIQGTQLEPFFKYRLSQLLSNMYLRQNEVEQAREQAQFIIDHCPNNSYVASAYHTLGLSFLYEDYEKGITALSSSLKCYQDYNKKKQIVEVRRGMFFFNNYWGIDGKYILYTNQIRDQYERAHFEFRRGQKEKAQVILKKIDNHSLSLSEQGYYFFYRGLAIDNIDLLYKSIESFKRIEDKFAANMARLELYRQGERPAAIEAAYN